MEEMDLRAGNWRRSVIAIFGALLVAAAGWAGSSSVTPNMRSSMPAGYEVIQLQPSGAVLSILGLIECPEMEGARRMLQGLESHIVAASGATLRRFPRHFSYRITASLRKTVIDPPTVKLNTDEDPAEMMLGLKFRLRAYDGLEAEEIPVESVTMIGVPADVAYDERVYRVSFDVGERAVTDRFVLEVYSPAGDRLARFHFELL
jgi:hypothetical protein